MSDFVWTFRDDLAVTGPELVGYRVVALDRPVGAVVAASPGGDRDYLLIHTPGWFARPLMLIPAGLVRMVAPDLDLVFVDRTADELRRGPVFRDDDVGSARFWEPYDEYYANGVPEVPV